MAYLPNNKIKFEDSPNLDAFGMIEQDIHIVNWLFNYGLQYI